MGDIKGDLGNRENNFHGWAQGLRELPQGHHGVADYQKKLTPEIYAEFSSFARQKKKGFKQQVDYLYDQDGRTGVGFIGQFEVINDNTAKVGQRLGVKFQRPHKNASTHSHYSQSYSDCGRDAVTELAPDDIKIVGYSFV